MSVLFSSNFLKIHNMTSFKISFLGSMFLPATTALGAGLYSISMYGGLVLFGAFLLYDTQKIVHKAENHPIYAYKPYDPINA